jgi:hypothetical protein
MDTSGSTHDAEIDRLYASAPDEFTAARDELAGRLRADGDREATAEVKRLRKPSLSAWALNQVRRREPELVDELIAAGQRLREAQEQLLTAGDRGALRAAAADERRLVEQLAELGERYLIETGHPATATLRSKLSETLHAVAGDSVARERLRSGRLTRDYQISDLGLAALSGSTTTTTATQSAPSAPAADRQPRPQPQARRAALGAELERQAADMRRALEQARLRQGERKRELDDAERRARDATQAAARAASTAEHEAQRAIRARLKAQQAAEQTDRLQAELSRLARDITDT